MREIKLVLVLGITIILIIIACNSNQAYQVTPTVEKQLTKVNITSTARLLEYPLTQYSGKIYYLVSGEDAGIWQLSLVNLKKTQLLKNEITGFDIDISSDGNWLVYSNDTWNRQGEKVTTLWGINTKTYRLIQIAPPLPLIRWRWLPNNILFYEQYPEYKDDEILIGTPPEIGGNIKSFIYDFVTNTRTERADLRLPLSFEGEERCNYYPSPAVSTSLVKVCRNILDDNQKPNAIIMQLNGSNVVTITNQLDGPLVWSTDGQRILLVQAANTARQLFIWESQTGDTRQITHTTEAYSFADLTWSFNKKWAAFHEQDGRVCFVDLSTGEINCVSGYRFPIGRKMSWSPDSRAFIIAAIKEGEPDPEGNDMYIISVPDGNVTRVTEDSSQFEYNPIWVR